MPFEDYPGRYELANELHARPFPKLSAPCEIAFLAIKRPMAASQRDRGEDRAHLLALLDRFGAAHPPEGASHFYGELGRDQLKWECHAEFATYTLFAADTTGEAFDGTAFERFPKDWLDTIPGAVLTSVTIHMIRSNDGIEDFVRHFVPESLATSEVLDNAALVGGDFRIDAAGHVRFVVLAREGTGARRLGRIVQRLLEIETYKSMSMLTLPIARKVSEQIATLDGSLTNLIEEMTQNRGAHGDDTLQRLLRMSSELEHLASETAFRFSATDAYAQIVKQRIELLREARYKGRQTLAEFMTRRFDPAVRTCASSNARLGEILNRAERAATLHRTRLEEDRASQNAALLASMDKRAEQQLHLQKTVEGLSVVAIGYYAVNLLVYLLAPFATSLGLDKTSLTALSVPVVLFAVWRVVRRIRSKF